MWAWLKSPVGWDNKTDVRSLREGVRGRTVAIRDSRVDYQREKKKNFSVGRELPKAKEGGIEGKVIR